MCSLTGIVMLPCMKSDFYKVMLMFMVALAVGTLVGNGVLVLIPEVTVLSLTVLCIFILTYPYCNFGWISWVGELTPIVFSGCSTPAISS